MEERGGEEQTNEVDWAELERAVKVSQQWLSKLKGLWFMLQQTTTKS